MKILAIASAGGHWIELLRLSPAFGELNVAYASTKASFAETLNEQPFFCIPDSSRWNKTGMMVSVWHVYKMLTALQPDLIITTGAAPGLIAIMLGRIMGAKTIWVDSIANVEELSLSGKIATYLAHKVYTQWPDLTKTNVFYSGNIIA